MRAKLATLFLVAPAATVLAVPPVVDGRRDASYLAPTAVQDTPTGFGDSNLGLIDFANGSELCAGYSIVENGNLYIFLAGNLESNFNPLEIFIDSVAGGQNQLRGDNPNVDFDGLNRMGDDGTGNGLQFDAGFEADYYITMSCGDNGGSFALFANSAQIQTGGGGTGEFLGQGGAGAGGRITATNGIQIAIDNSNTAGVDGATVNDPADVASGIEICIPLSLLGDPDPFACTRWCAFINGGGHGFVSNQVLGGLGGGANLGEPRAVNLDAIAGDQQSEACPPSIEAFGFRVDQVGQARIKETTDRLVVNNIGSSGQDGVSITLDLPGPLPSPGQLIAPGFALDIPAGNPIGSRTTVEDFVELDGAPGAAVVGSSILLDQVDPANLELTFAFPGLGAPTYTLELLLDNQVVFTQTGFSGPSCRLRAAATCGGCTIPLEKCERRLFALPNPTPITVIGGPTLLASSLIVSAESPTAEAKLFVSTQVRGECANWFPPDVLFEIPDIFIPIGGAPSSATGQARFNARHDHLTVSNIGSSGEDGVRIDLGAGRRLGLLGPLDDGVSLPFRTPININTGSTELLRLDATGNVGGLPAGANLGSSIACHNEPWAHIDLSADYSPIGAQFVVVEIYNNGTLVSTDVVPAGIAACVDSDNDGLPQVSGCGKLPGFPQLPCFFWQFDRPGLITPNSATGTPVVGNEVRLLAEGGSQVSTIETFSVKWCCADSFFDVDYGDRIAGPPDLPPVYAFGLKHNGLGNASLDASGGRLTVSNIGSSGKDGVSIDLGDSEGFLHALDAMDASTLSNGSSMETTVFMRPALDCPPIPCALSTLTANNGQFEASLAIDGATSFTTQVFNAGQLVGEVQGQDPTVPVFVLADGLVPSGASFLYKVGTLGCEYCAPAPATIEIARPGQTPLSVVGDAVQVRANGVVANESAAIATLRASGDISSFQILDEAIAFFSDGNENGEPNLHRAEGGARLDGRIDLLEGRKLKISNLGSSGCDGFSVAPGGGGTGGAGGGGRIALRRSEWRPFDICGGCCTVCGLVDGIDQELFAIEQVVGPAGLEMSIAHRAVRNPNAPIVSNVFLTDETGAIVAQALDVPDGLICTFPNGAPLSFACICTPFEDCGGICDSAELVMGLEFDTNQDVTLVGFGTFSVRRIAVVPQNVGDTITELTRLGDIYFVPVVSEVDILDETVANPPAFPFGLPHLPLGTATLETSGGRLTVSNIGSSGKDGVSIDLGETEFITMEFETPLALAQPDSFFDIDYGDRASNSYTILTTALPTPGRMGLGMDTSSMGPTGLQVQVFNAGLLVDSQTISPPPAASSHFLEIHPPGCMVTPYRAPKDGSDPFMRLVLPEPGPINFPGLLPEVGDEVLVTFLSPTDPLLDGALVTMNGGGIPDFTISAERIGLFNNEHTALGQARFEPRGDRLVVSNIGSSGEDGVSITLDTPSTTGFFVEPEYHSGYDPVSSLEADGQAFELSASGGLGGAPDRFLGSATLQNTAGVVNVLADFTPTGSDQVRVQILDGSALTGEVILPAGNVGSMTSIGNPFSLNKCGKLGGATTCLVACTDEPFLFEASDGITSAAGNEIRLLVEGPPLPIDNVSNFTIRGTDLGRFDIANEVIPPPPVCPCERNDDGVLDVNDLLDFLAEWFAQTGAPPPGGVGTGADFDASNLVDINDLLGFLSCWFAGTAPGASCP